jgi:hypothetical protein
MAIMGKCPQSITIFYIHLHNDLKAFNDSSNNVFHIIHRVSDFDIKITFNKQVKQVQSDISPPLTINVKCAMIIKIPVHGE